MLIQSTKQPVSLYQISMTDKPNPGSDEAIDQGCTCPVLDNAHGEGYMGVSGRFMISADCPIHNPGEYE